MEKDLIKTGNTILKVENAVRGALRWAVGSSTGARGSTWRLWGNKKGDGYISTRTLGGILKASFHRDGNCHIGFTAEYADTAKRRFPQLGGRHLDKWKLAEAPLVKLMQVVVPESELRAYEHDDATQMKWLPPPAAGSLSVVSVYKATLDWDKEPWPGSHHGTQPLGVILNARGITWAVYLNNPVDAGTASWIEQHRSKIAERPGAADAPRTPSTRVIMWGFRENHPYLFELAWD